MNSNFESITAQDYTGNRMVSKVLKFFFAILASLPLRADPIYFSIIVASYNNEKFYEWNLNSILSQTYPHYTVHYVNDASTDQTLSKVRKFLAKHPQGKKVKVIHNAVNKGALSNIHYVISLLVPKGHVVVLVDGDDALAHKDVLKDLSQVYQNKNIWLTYGQFQYKSSGKRGFCVKIPEDVLKTHRMRKFPYVTSHLRTFYAWLFKRIKLEDLMYKAKFFDMCSDLAIMFPMIEMAKWHFQFIPSILYIYNDQNPINDFKKNHARQLMLDKEIRQRPSYAPIE